MLKFLFSFYAAKRRKRYERSFELGFGWVMTDRFYYHVPTENIEQQIYEDGWNPGFDDGARTAIAILNEIEE